MKRNKLTPGYNLLWESSRMMLPEHREQFLEHRRGLNQKNKPLLDEQERERLDQAFFYAFQNKQPVILTLFDPFQPFTYHGMICGLNPEKKQLKFQHEEGRIEWLSHLDITNVSYKETI